MNIVLLGYPGSGKGTQANTLSAKLNLAQVSFGRIFWNEVAKKTPLGHEVSDNLVAGWLVPDWLVLGQLKERFKDERRGFLFDGFPSTTEQAEGLDAWLEARSTSVDAVIMLKLPEAEVLKRLAQRRVCPGCGAIYNLATSPTFMEGLCDSCGGKLQQRQNDRPEAIKKRLMAYKDQTEPVMSYYRGSSKCFEVKADQSAQDVTTQILALVKNL